MKLFTLDEANSLLPKVRSLLLKLQASHRTVSSLRKNAKAAANSAQFGGGGMTEGTLYVNALYEMTEISRRIDDLGIQIKDFERGLIDFPSIREGRIVLLCWQLGEGDELEWWHDMEAGFAGRQRI